MDGERQAREAGASLVMGGRRFWPASEGGPFLFQDVTVLTFSVTFRSETIARRLPPGLQPCEESCGGFEFLLARRGPIAGTYTAATVWFDLASPRGDLVAPRFAARRFASLDLGGEDGVSPGQTRLCEEADVISAELSASGRGLMRAVLQPGTGGFFAAGVTRYLGGARGLAETVPWSALLSDAVPLSLDILDPDLADLAPLTVFGATLGTDGALALGIAACPA